MKFLSRKRPEKSEYALALAVFYSFFLHAAVVATALFLHIQVTPKVVLPPAYQVKLVGQPKESVPTPTPAAAPAPAPPKKEAMPVAAKPSPKTKKAVVALKKVAPKKDSVPDLAQQKKTPAPVEQTKSNEAAPQKPAAAPPAPAAGPATTGNKNEGVGSITLQQDFRDSKYSSYIDNVRREIGENWNPPPGSKDAKARVIFKLNRSGRIEGVVRLDDEHSNGSFTFKMAARRAIEASRFPSFQDDFYQSSLEFTVDLIPKD